MSMKTKRPPATPTTGAGLCLGTIVAVLVTLDLSGGNLGKYIQILLCKLMEKLIVKTIDKCLFVAQMFRKRE